MLSHILGSNPQICGYSELQIPYIDQSSINKMHSLLLEEKKNKFNNKYLLDKILHEFELTDNALKLTTPKIIFLLREPEGTIKSLINMAHITGKTWYEDPQKGLEYYNSRLIQLENLSKQIAGNYFFIESDDLVNDTDLILENLTNWLSLKQPLNKEYSLFQNTGKPTYGDPSSNIKTGVLEQTKGHPNIVIPQDILQKAQKSYDNCKEALLRGQDL